MDNNYIIDKIKSYCLNNNISTKDVLSITIQKNRSSNFTSLTIDFNNNLILPNYPIEGLTSYEETTIGDYKVCYKSNLPVIHTDTTSMSSSSSLINEDSPFCCSEIRPYKPQRLDREIEFTNFLNKNGSSKDVFEIKRQIDNGPIVSTKYFKLLNGEHKQVEGKFNQKRHAFKNYKCSKHNLFFMVDLYADNSNQEVYNHHHMRLNPITKINKDVLNSFFGLI